MYGEEYEQLRLERASMARFCCECGCNQAAPYMRGADQPLWAGQLAHLGRGAKRNSVIAEVRWMRRECHDRFDNRNQKVVPSKRAGKEGV